MRLAVIPARGGSKRLPRKNIRPFLGRPMIAYALEAARQAGLFDRVVVSTDDAEIAGLAQSLGAEVPFLRPAHLADDHAPTVQVVAHAVRACALAPHASVTCIYPAVPLLRAHRLREALALFEAGGCDYVFPVLRFPSPIQRALRRDADGGVRAIDPSQARTRTQDLEPAWYDAGQFYVGRGEAWLAERDLHTGARTLALSSWEAVDIDTPEDWERAERLARAIGEENGDAHRPAR